jgi:hypothetical protein
MINKQGLILPSDNIEVRPLNVKDVTEEYVDGLNDPDVNKLRALWRRIGIIHYQSYLVYL